MLSLKIVFRKSAWCESCLVEFVCVKSVRSGRIAAWFWFTQVPGGSEPCAAIPQRMSHRSAWVTTRSHERVKENVASGVLRSYDLIISCS